jgi:uroporphyrinogen decarboxylase
MPLTHRERLQACLANSPALDRPPVALWRHFPVDDQDPAALAAAVLDFQRHYDFDMVKVTPASSYSIKDWGAEDAWQGHTEGTRSYTKRIISQPQDWEHLPLLSPDELHLSQHLDCLRRIRSGLLPHTPLLPTIFSPLAQAKNLAGGERLLDHLHRHPQAVLKGLETIAKTTSRYIEACMEVGIDGIFYAVQHAQNELLTLNEYKLFGLPNDLICLAPASSLWCNLLHLHGLTIHFELVSQSLYPEGLFQIVNWHDRETRPTLAEGLKDTRATVCGGISQKTIVFGNQSDILKEAADAIAQSGGRHLILGTGCVVPIIAPHGNIFAAREFVEKDL